MSGGELPAALTLPGQWVAVVAVSIAMTRTADWETPESWQAVGTLTTRGPGDTVTLTS